MSVFVSGGGFTNCYKMSGCVHFRREKKEAFGGLFQCSQLIQNDII